jgi:hypothetical protein
VIAALLFAIVERTVIPGGAGPNRLDPDAAVLASAAPLRYDVSGDGSKRVFRFTGGLEDLRLRSSTGEEHPYLIVAPPARVPQWRTTSLRPITPTKTSSGFEADLGVPVNVDRIRLDGLASPVMKRLRLEGSGDRVRWTVLSPDATIFDLPDQELRNLEVAFNPGSFRYLRVTWDDRSSAAVRQVGDLAARIYDASPQPGAEEIPLTFRRVSSETGKSRYRLSLPGPHLPIAAIRFDVSNANVFRDADVTEGRLTGSTVEPVSLGGGKLRRAERAEGVAEELTVPISFPETADLDVVVDDANNPPLTIARIAGIVAPLPWIYFETSDTAPLTATYGDPAPKPARYDLEARRSTASSARTVAAKWSPSTLSTSRPSNAVTTPATGSSVDRKQFRFARSMAPAASGLTSLLLDADVLARSSALRDVRIATADGHQVPYVVEHRDAPLAVPLRVPPRGRGEGARSVYIFELPYDSLPDGTRLTITTSARVFERNATLSRTPDEQRGRDREVIASQTWRSTDPESPAPPLTFAISRSGTHEVQLELDEGDNAPLPITGAQLVLPSYALRFINPGGSLTLLYGNAAAEAPRYDLALLAPRLFAESARDINLMQAAPMIATPESTTERKVFWIVIVAAVLALLITLGRLLSGSSPSVAGPSPRERGEG